ncbi:hypothetical protein LHJ74_30870 [Streptomyces sp. N2-109]|uniref:Uncharacterized protein n=1 Tax=Streptomyces gossypii TaxID=2883101 RepID=A0ABT2K270_9ACTN|nr:hypothetical protein [Streptomyces gossypii]MCT2594260.1 hypothetical protein [Streptomyces gossypii]
MAKNGYTESTNPDDCGHPNMQPVIYRTEEEPTKDQQGAECPGCDESWPK